MSDTVSINSALVLDGPDPLDEYRSRPRQLARWLLASRDALRKKYQELKVESKRLKVRIHDLVISRDQWKQRVEFSQRQIQEMTAEVQRLTALLEQERLAGDGLKKKSDSPASDVKLPSPGDSILEPPADLKPAQSPVLIIPPGPPINEQERLPRHSFSLSSVTYFCGLALNCCSSISAVTKTLAFFFPEQARQGQIPHATSGRMWLLRLGYYKLHAPLEKATDWIFFADHAIEIGKHRFLGILGIRQSQLPAPGECLQLADMTPVALLPVEASSGDIVHQQLKDVVAETGIVPQAILSDEGSDLSAGIDCFCQTHPDTTRYRDLPHVAARLLKKRLEKNPRWIEFIKQVTQTKFETAQTELAFLVPPRLRSKARYMNLQSMLGWAEKVLKVLNHPGVVVPSFCSLERLNTKFAWLREFREDVALWSSWLALTDTALQIVRRQGYCSQALAEAKKCLGELSTTPEQELLKNELLEVIEAESSKHGGEQRIPGSTEILESSFGKLKEIEGDQVRSGFTSLILIWAALFGATSPEIIFKAMTQITEKLVTAWVRTHLGETIQSKRAKLHHALRNLSTENPEEP